jgi:hypothetical protein
MKHKDLLAVLKDIPHERISETCLRFHHGYDPHDAAGLHVRLHGAGYYPAGVDRTVADAWAGFRFNAKNKPLHQIGIYRKINPHGTHFTDIVVY